MATRLSQDEFTELLNTERDTFRLAIRGHAAVEGKIDEILADAFPVGLPRFMKGLGFRRKLELAVALGLVPPSYNDSIGRLTQLRNDFSHGRVVTLDSKGAAHLIENLAEIAPGLTADELWSKDDPRGMLILSIAVIWFSLANCEEQARAQRSRVASALASVEKRKFLEAFLRDRRLTAAERTSPRAEDL